MSKTKLKDFDSGRGPQYNGVDYRNYCKTKRQYIKEKKDKLKDKK